MLSFQTGWGVVKGGKGRVVEIVKGVNTKCWMWQLDMCYGLADRKSIIPIGILYLATDLNHALRRTQFLCIHRGWQAQCRRRCCCVFMLTQTSPVVRVWCCSIYLSSNKYLKCKIVVGDDTKVLSAEYALPINILALISPAFHWLMCVDVRVCLQCSVSLACISSSDMCNQ